MREITLGQIAAFLARISGDKLGQDGIFSLIGTTPAPNLICTFKPATAHEQDAPHTCDGPKGQHCRRFASQPAFH